MVRSEHTQCANRRRRHPLGVECLRQRRRQRLLRCRQRRCKAWPDRWRSRCKARRRNSARGERVDLRNIGLTAGSSLKWTTLQTVAEMTVEMLHAHLPGLSFRDDTHLLRVCAASFQHRHSVSGRGGSRGSLQRAPFSQGCHLGEDGVEPPRLAPRNLSEYFAVRAGIAVPIRDGARYRCYPGVSAAAALLGRRGAASRGAGGGRTPPCATPRSTSISVPSPRQYALLPRVARYHQRLGSAAYLPRSTAWVELLRSGAISRRAVRHYGGRCPAAGLPPRSTRRWEVYARRHRHEEPGCTAQDQRCHLRLQQLGVFLTLFHGVRCPGGRSATPTPPILPDFTPRQRHRASAAGDDRHGGRDHPEQTIESRDPCQQKVS